MLADDIHDPAGRRRFIQVLALSGAAFMVGHAATPRAQTAPTTSTPATGAGADSTTATTTAEPPISDDARSLADIVRRRYGTHLDAAQLEAVTQELNQRLQSGTRLRAVKLANGDEPATTFHA